MPEPPEIGDWPDHLEQVAGSVEAQVSTTEPCQPPPSPPIRHWHQVADDPPVKWLVDGLLPSPGLVVLAGDPGAAKTLLILDIALHAAHGMDWLGRRVRPFSTLYMAGEGTGGLGTRLRAWSLEHESVEDANHYVAICDGVIDLAGATCAIDLARTLEATAEHYSAPPDLLVIDTLAMAMPGHDENDASAVGVALRTLTEATRRANLTVVLVHHARKPSRDRGGQRGLHDLRGSSALAGAADVVLLAGNQKGVRQVEVVKVRDGELPSPIDFSIAQRETGRLRDDGSPESGPLVAPAHAPGDACVQERDLAVAASAAKNTVVRIMRELGGFVSSKERVYERMSGKTNRKRAAFSACLDEGIIVESGRGSQKRYDLVAPSPPSEEVCVFPQTPSGGEGEERPTRPSEHEGEGEKGEGASKHGG